MDCCPMKASMISGTIKFNISDKSSIFAILSWIPIEFYVFDDLMSVRYVQNFIQMVCPIY